MITIKKKHNITLNKNFIDQFNSVIRFAYNRIIKDKIIKQSELEQLVKNKMSNINELDASWIKSAVKKATELSREGKLYFGGKKQFFKRKYKKIENIDKNFPIEMLGSASDGGNRKARLNDNILIFKINKNNHIEIKLDLSKNERKMLNVIQDQAKEKKEYFNIKLDNKYIYISFNEPVIEKHSYIKDRYLGIDLNPNFIAVSITDYGFKDVFKEIIDLKELNKLNKNKKEYELSIISKHVINLCKHYSVERVCLEELSMSSKNYKRGKNYNRLLNNDWNRNFFVNNLCKWLNINDIKCSMVNPFYTSFMGQIKNEADYDSIAASKEIAFRGYLMNKGINVYNYVNEFLSGLVTTRWKEMLLEGSTFKDLYTYFKKKSGDSYRFLFNDVEKTKWSYFRLNSYKSMIKVFDVI